MNAWARGKKGYKSIYVPTLAGPLVQRSCSTKDANTVRAMIRMVEDLRGAGRWIILGAIAYKKPWRPPGSTKPVRFTLRACYPFYAANQLDELESLLAAKNLADSLTPWITWVRANRQEDVRTADVYWQQVTTLIPDGGRFLAHELTKERVKTWLASREKATSGTRRKYLYALKSFVSYLVDAGVLKEDPLAGMKAPKKNPARARWETAAVDESIVQSANEDYRALFAFIKGTGCDVGSARRVQKGDVDLKAMRTDLRGTKTDRRKVHRGAIEAWAIPYITDRVKSTVGRHTLLFPSFTNSGASHHHERCCAAVGVEDYTLKDARHSVAVRMRLRGVAFEDIAEQLGTSVYQVAQTYARYKPEDAARAKEATG